MGVRKYKIIAKFSTEQRKKTAAWLAQLEERQSAERKVAGSNPGRTNTLHSLE